MSSCVAIAFNHVGTLRDALDLEIEDFHDQKKALTNDCSAKRASFDGGDGVYAEGLSGGHCCTLPRYGGNTCARGQQKPTS